MLQCKESSGRVPGLRTTIAICSIGVWSGVRQPLVVAYITILFQDETTGELRRVNFAVGSRRLRKAAEYANVHAEISQGFACGLGRVRLGSGC